jgi:threonine dehydratase
MVMNVLQDILRAEHKIRPYIRTTPLEFSEPLSKLTGGRIFLKLENTQNTGSFKVRGAMNALLSLTSQQRAKGVVTASSGNHGLAVAFGLHTLKIPGIIFVPEDTASTKIASIRHYDTELRFWGNDCVITEQYARSYAAQHESLALQSI